METIEKEKCNVTIFSDSCQSETVINNVGVLTSDNPKVVITPLEVATAAID